MSARRSTSVSAFEVRKWPNDVFARFHPRVRCRLDIAHCTCGGGGPSHRPYGSGLSDRRPCVHDGATGPGRSRDGVAGGARGGALARVHRPESLANVRRAFRAFRTLAGRARREALPPGHLSDPGCGLGRSASGRRTGDGVRQLRRVVSDGGKSRCRGAARARGRARIGAPDDAHLGARAPWPDAPQLDAKRDSTKSPGGLGVHRRGRRSDAPAGGRVLENVPCWVKVAAYCRRS